MLTQPCIILVDRVNAAEREAVHEIVRTHARGWWHRFPDVWIAGGHPPKYWKKLIKPVIPYGSSSVLVLRLPDEPEENDIGYFGIDGEQRLEWLYRNLRDRPMPRSLTDALPAAGETASRTGTPLT